MSVVRRSRSLVRRGVKVQRRVALAQMLFWPLLIGGGLAAGATALAVRRRSRADTHPAPPVVVG
ncbi:hypothetical protein C6A87_011690 [Mycobacterium sp. ITM-2016-00317]|uniref:hypothetical protein n=1 Tax=Mycobacterium sp. ITM-2016-00317 TaxID=2099694 RepID=UPI00287F667B|nr:hypothetical protein [Mycobacterium sp. ITM-2016-00317]WNG89745.1 hypothetical protein C6A87_011690 [Mycobacterium sp. ITM-2016-00317]